MSVTAPERAGVASGPGPGAAARAPVSARSDEALGGEAREGSRSAFTEIVARYGPRVYAFLCRRTGSRDLAEDLTQETFVLAWRKIDRYDPSQRLAPWLFTLAARTASTHRRRRRPPAAMLSPETAGERGAPAAPGVPARHPLHERVWGIAGRVLTPDQHEAVWLHYAQGLTPAEVAVVMGRTGVGVRVLLFRARQRLASELVGDGPAGPGDERSGGEP